MRDDPDVDAITYAFQATFEGFLQAEAAAVTDLLTDLAEADRADLGVPNA